MGHYRRLKINESELIVKNFLFTLGERDREIERQRETETERKSVNFWNIILFIQKTHMANSYKILLNLFVNVLNLGFKRQGMILFYFIIIF